MFAVNVSFCYMFASAGSAVPSQFGFCVVRNEFMIRAAAPRHRQPS